jgi:hypothetical protein
MTILKKCSKKVKEMQPTGERPIEGEWKESRAKNAGEGGESDQTL